jgi:hypothetical protein
MGNVINRNTVFMECMSLVDNNVFASGEMVSVYKIENIWVTQNLNGKYFRVPASLIRNEKFTEVEERYSMSDIIYYLMDRNTDYQTICWALLEEAVLTAFKEMYFYGATLDDIYNYISGNLI